MISTREVWRGSSGRQNNFIKKFLLADSWQDPTRQDWWHLCRLWNKLKANIGSIGKTCNHWQWHGDSASQHKNKLTSPPQNQNRFSTKEWMEKFWLIPRYFRDNNKTRLDSYEAITTLNLIERNNPVIDWIKCKRSNTRTCLNLILLESLNGTFLEAIKAL